MIIQNPLDKRLYAPNEQFSLNTPRDEQIAVDLAQALMSTDRLSLAANQIGYNYTLVALKLPMFGSIGVMLLVNPRFIELSKQELEWGTETCISHPGIMVDVCRLNHIEILASTFSDHTERRYAFSGPAARAIQHSHNHLKGKLITDLPEAIRGQVRIDFAGQAKLFEINRNT